MGGPRLERPCAARPGDGADQHRIQLDERDDRGDRTVVLTLRASALLGWLPVEQRQLNAGCSAESTFALFALQQLRPIHLREGTWALVEKFQSALPDLKVSQLLWDDDLKHHCCMMG